MAEGGFLPWRTQPADGVVYADYSQLREALPPPPQGFHWEQRSDSGEWELVDESSLHHAGDKTAEEEPEDAEDPLPEELGFIEHTIMPSDTLTGICLRYRVSRDELRKHNDFFGENFRLCLSLRIPVQHLKPWELRRQENTEEVKLQKLRNLTKMPKIEAKVYLEEYGGNIELAFAAWKEDNDWEAAVSGKHIKIDPLSTKPSASMAVEATAVPIAPLVEASLHAPLAPLSVVAAVAAHPSVSALPHGTSTPVVLPTTTTTTTVVLPPTAPPVTRPSPSSSCGP